MHKNTLIKIIIHRYFDVKLYAMMSIETIMKIKFKL